MNYLQFLRRSQAAKIAQMFASGEQGLVYDIDNISTLFQDSAFTVPVTAVEQPVGGMLDLSGRGNHAFMATTTKRSIYSRRVNLHAFNTNTFADAILLKTGNGLLPVVTPNYAAAPNGSITAIRLQLNSVDTSGTAYSIVYRDILGGGQIAAAYRTSIWMRATTGTATVTLVGAGTVISLQSLNTTWREVSLNETGIAGSTFALRIASSASNATAGPQDILVWQPSLTLATDAHLPYQYVNTSVDYDADPAKFPAYRRADGVDDSLASSTGGGGTAGFFVSAAISPQGRAGTARTLFSDTGANTGYRVRLNTSNQLELAAGNGTAYTTIATADTLAVGATDVVQAWDDGANLNVKIGSGPTASIARPAVVAGTAGYTLGQDNGASTRYFNGRSYGEIYRKDSGLTQSQREAVAVYQRQKARIA